MKNVKKLTILHSNDMHGDFLSEDASGNLIGGVSMLSGYIQKVRAEEENVLYTIAGDMFRGSVIDSEYKGISTIEIVNMLTPDVVTLGNHEVDYGIGLLILGYLQALRIWKTMYEIRWLVYQSTSASPKLRCLILQICPHTIFLQ